MIISHKHRFIFLKTRKTGGTSIELSLRPYCGPDDIITPVTEDRDAPQCGGPRNYLHNPETWTLAERIGWWLRGDHVLKRCPTVGFFGHARGSEVRDRLPRQIWHSYFKFTIERNPWDRQVSHYFWKTRHSGKRRPTFRSYLLRTRPLKNWEIYTDQNVVIVDDVIRYEKLRDGLKMATGLGIRDFQHLVRAKSTYRPGTVSYRSLYDDELRSIVADWYRREIEHFGWKF